ncbi:MAG: type I-A CRISPR-associated protein Cas5 [Sulfolobus sp.]|nr:type I-A CRISPR-associated protein Cas5 [Sulfolobus sp.]
MKGILVSFYFPVLSIKHVESYQVASSYPMLMPSTIIGGIAYSLHMLNICNGNQCLEEARNLISKAREIPHEIPIQSNFILKRSRVLEGEAKWDAMVRQGILHNESKILLLPRKNDIDLIRRALYLVARLGDSESLVTVKDIKEVDFYECDVKKINVPIRISQGIMSKLGGNYMIYPMTDENGNRAMFALPLSSIQDRYAPSDITFNGATLCSSDNRIFIPQGEEW